ncbi:UNVERIFIED_CONTAM: hypothetical protein NCL1_37758 [Trichonephila clavipes]
MVELARNNFSAPVNQKKRHVNKPDKFPSAATLHQLFGVRKTSCQLHDVYELLICSLDESYSLCVELFSERKICGKVPKVSSPVVINELNRRGVILSDLANEDCEIDILLGTNVAGLLFMGGSVELDSGFVVIRSDFLPILRKHSFSWELPLSIDIFLSFFYPDEGEEIVYRHCRVVFSVSSSPFLLAAVLPHLLENVPADDSQLCSKLKLSLYVDNCFTGVNDIAQQEEFF